MSSTVLSQPDDNLVPGQTYTFQFKLSNWFGVPSTDIVQTDITNNAPNFVEDLQVTSPSLTSLYNCQFTYNGDGSDVVSDVASSLAAAIKTGSGDNMTFIGAVPDTAQSITVSPSTAAQKISDSVGSAVNSALTGAGKTIADTAQNVLTPIEIALAIVVGLVVLVIFTSGKAGGVSASAEGVNIGGK